MRTNTYQREGEEAYLLGVPCWRNPYPIGPKAFAWRVGWSLMWSLDDQRERAVQKLAGNRKGSGG